MPNGGGVKAAAKINSNEHFQTPWITEEDEASLALGGTEPFKHTCIEFTDKFKEHWITLSTKKNKVQLDDTQGAKTLMQTFNAILPDESLCYKSKFISSRGNVWLCGYVNGLQRVGQEDLAHGR